MEVITGNHYLAFVLSKETRQRLLSKYDNYIRRHGVVVCHHITIAYDFGEDDVQALQNIVDNTKIIETTVLLLGDGIDCFMAVLDDSPSRPFGGFYHITSSRSSQRSNVEANDLVIGELPVFQTVQAREIINGEFMLIPKKVNIN